MKAIIVFLLLVIISILGYNFYHNYQRFNPPNYYYTTDKNIPSNPENKEILKDYHNAIEKLNGYVITQWSANDIDVRNPEDDDDVTKAAVSEYTDKLGLVKYYEGELMRPVEDAQTIARDAEKTQKKEHLRKMFHSDPKMNAFRIGEKSPLIFEVQGILNTKGADIKQDGHYRTETEAAIKVFETNNNLFPDGKMDALTLETLLQ